MDALLGGQARAGRILLLTETAVTVEKGCWPPGSQKDQVSFKALLVDDSSSLKRGEYRALGLRQPKPGYDQRVHHQRGINGYQELFKAGALKRRHRNCTQN